MTAPTVPFGATAAQPSDEASGQFDPWLAASVLQKAIRRGQADAAVRAAFAYARTRGRGVWRRLLIVAFEDVSIGEPDVLLEAADQCVSALTCRSWKADRDRLELLVRRLAVAPKDRAPDHLLTAAAFSPHLDQMRGVPRAWSVSEYMAAVADASRPMVEKALATAFVLQLDDQGRMPPGALAPQSLLPAFHDLGVPTDLVDATRSAAKLTGEAITLMTPLLWLASRSVNGGALVTQAIPTSPLLGGVPACALDKHTAVGKAAILRFAAENRLVRDALSRAARTDRLAAVAGMAVFHAEGAAIAARRLWNGAIELEQLGIEADMFKAGADPAEADAVLAAVRDNLDHLHAIRAELVRLRPHR
jgi:hypothetical protein